MKIVLFPDKMNGNPYLDIIKKAISGDEIEIHGISEITYRPWKDKQFKSINLNWFDSIAGNSNIKAVLLFIRQILRVYYYKFVGMKVIYTLHNKQAHDTKYVRINQCLRKFLCRKSDYIVGLCEYTKVILRDFLTEEEIQKKVRIMYHPSYDGIYPDKGSAIPEGLPNGDAMKILFTGSIRKYKNIELLIDIINSTNDLNIEWVLAGKPVSNDYGKQILESIAKKNRVKCVFRFIETEEMPSLYNWADAVILPMSYNSSLNSGSAVLAASMGKTIIAPNIGTLRDFPCENMFVYDYDSEDEHAGALQQTVRSAYSEWMRDPEEFTNKGIRIKDYVNREFSFEKTRERYQLFYEEVHFR